MTSKGVCLMSDMLNITHINTIMSLAFHFHTRVLNQNVQRAINTLGSGHSKTDTNTFVFCYILFVGN